MKYAVEKPFIDKNTKVFYDTSAVYETDSQDRAKELQKAGYIKDQAESNSLLSGTVEEVFSSLEGLSKEEYEQLLEEEKAGKKRKTVIAELERLIAADGDSDESGKA
ncbi:hypothetical protein [Mesobacillus subterraneus]|uniref:Uncharacterized protein n=1 Tax=Mesobacillus subterraneus TaxID=285983 RepID=A0A3R9DZC8_9BACI|nr:hypothetical protein [Mesobacillus subterraneus]RSD21073.1 hypothetical protein EJA10_22505 [Mesobacillus subterraneus]